MVSFRLDWIFIEFVILVIYFGNSIFSFQSMALFIIIFVWGNSQPIMRIFRKQTSIRMSAQNLKISTKTLIYPSGSFRSIITDQR